MQVGHRNLRCIFPFLEGTSWKTSASKHIAAYMVVSPLLISLFCVCVATVSYQMPCFKRQRLHATVKLPFSMAKGWLLKLQWTTFCRNCDNLHLSFVACLAILQNGMHWAGNCRTNSESVSLQCFVPCRRIFALAVLTFQCSRLLSFSKVCPNQTCRFADPTWRIRVAYNWRSLALHFLFP